MGSMCPIHLQSPRVTRQLFTVPVSPVSPQGWQSPTVLLWAFPCHSALHPRAPHRHGTPHTPSTPHPMLPSPNHLCNQHHAHAAPKCMQHPNACSTQAITPYTQSPQHTARPTPPAPHTPHEGHPSYLKPEPEGVAASIHPVPSFVFPDAELLGSLSDLCLPLACFPSPAGPDARVRDTAALPLCSGSVLG